jgi:hypothetical protein
MAPVSARRARAKRLGIATYSPAAIAATPPPTINTFLPVDQEAQPVAAGVGLEALEVSALEVSADVAGSKPDAIGVPPATPPDVSSVPADVPAGPACM